MQASAVVTEIRTGHPVTELIKVLAAVKKHEFCIARDLRYESLL
jgi:hypothetical protein